VTLVFPILAPILASDARTAGHTVSAAEQREPSHYTIVCAAVEIRFVPLAQETGGWSGVVFHYFPCLRTAKRPALEYLVGGPGTPSSVHFL
jgi:hypothetical protein